MREIKFRAWDNKRNIYDYNYDVSHYEEPGTWLNHVFHNERFVFQQYTGFKDINDKEMYEGDIVKLTTPDNFSFNAEIRWDQKDGGWAIVSISQEKVYDGPLCHITADQCEVIGCNHV